MSRKGARLPKPGDRVVMRGATLIATELIEDDDSGVPTIVFTPATVADVNKLASPSVTKSSEAS